MNKKQAATNIMLVRPASFLYNTETAVSNAFQNKPALEENVQELALQEFDRFVDILRSKGVHEMVVEDTPLPQKPDAIFPNNWISMHEDGTVILYPMCAGNRRQERREDVLETLREKFEVKAVVDLSEYEKENRFLEGTGSVVFDHIHRVAYACISPRTDKILFLQLCNALKYEPLHFNAVDSTGKEIYHTNVMMCVGNGFAVVCLESIKNADEQEKVLDKLAKTGHEIIDINYYQMHRFAGNMLLVENDIGKNFLVMSKSAHEVLSHADLEKIGKHCEPLPLAISHIESIGGGSARCMMAEIFLPERI